MRRIMKYSAAEQRKRMREFDRWTRRARKAYEHGYAVVLVSIGDYMDGKKTVDAIFGKSQFPS